MTTLIFSHKQLIRSINFIRKRNPAFKRLTLNTCIKIIENMARDAIADGKISASLYGITILLDEIYDNKCYVNLCVCVTVTDPNIWSGDDHFPINVELN